MVKKDTQPPNTPENMLLRHLKDAIEVQKKALKKLRSIDPLKLSNSEAIRFLTAGANLERMCMRELLGHTPDKGSIQDDLAAVEEFLRNPDGSEHL